MAGHATGTHLSTMESDALTASAKRSGPGRPRSQESEEAILKATMELLAEGGYSILTLDKIAARARASKTTIYRRWPSKEHLVIAALDRTPPLQPRGRGPVLEELLDLLSQFIGVLDSTPLAGALPTLVGERAHNPGLAAVLDPLIARRRDPVKEVLRRAIDNGELPRSTDLELAVDAIMGPMVLRLFFLQGDVSRRALRKLLKLVLTGLGASD